MWTYLASIPPYFLTSKPESCYRIRYETEIGVQTALGVTVPSIVALLSKDVLWLVGTAVLLGMPPASTRPGRCGTSRGEHVRWRAAGVRKRTVGGPAGRPNGPLRAL